MRTSLSKLMFNVRSKTLHIKDCCPWNFSDINCVACGKFPEIFYHFTVCEAYRNKPVPDWYDINKTDTDRIVIVCIAIKRVKERNLMIKKEEVGWASITNSIAPGYCRALLQL